MNHRARAFELFTTVAVLLVVMVFVMWARQRDSSCTRSRETPRRLVLSRDTDREHLSNDVASVNRIARRFAASPSQAAEPPAPFLTCQATLFQQLASTHGVSLEQVHQSAD